MQSASGDVPLFSWKGILFRSLPWVVAFGIGGIAFKLLYSPSGRSLHQTAWEASFEERGLPIPREGPSGGYWGIDLAPKVAHPVTGWYEGEISIPGSVEVDERGYKHYVSDAWEKRSTLILGGSVASGAYSSDIEHVYYHRIGRELEARGHATDITIVASGAWKSTQELGALDLYLRDFPAPDLVVFLNGLNDLTSGPTVDLLFGEEMSGRLTPEGLLKDHDARAHQYIEQMKIAAELLAARGTAMLVVLQPNLMEKAHRSPIEDTLLTRTLRQIDFTAEDLLETYDEMRTGIERLASSTANLSFYDASSAFDTETTTTFGDIWHFSDPAHAILAQAMVDDIAFLVEKASHR